MMAARVMWPMVSSGRVKPRRWISPRFPVAIAAMAPGMSSISGLRRLWSWTPMRREIGRPIRRGIDTHIGSAARPRC